MKLVSRRFRSYLTFILSVFLLSYLLINYANFVPDRKHKPPKSNFMDFNVPQPEAVKDEVTQTHEIKPQDDHLVLIPETNRTEPKRYYAIDGNGRGSVNREVLKCAPNLEVEVVNSNYDKADFSYFLDSVPDRSYVNSIVDPKKKRHYLMVYAMESEPHSGGGQTWLNADFFMWYHLELSFPAPATYFDLHTHLPNLLAPPKFEFEEKSTGDLAPLVWVLSNCNAFNRREAFVKKLMSLITVDSYGYCLRNKDTHTSQRMQGNVDLFSKYKFVIAIENSNCDGYVTEKLVHAVASGSIPIVAGRDNKPNYLKYLPKNSFINVYDYKTVEDLVSHIKKVASSKDEYEKYIWFKRKHNFTREQLIKMPLAEVIQVAKHVLGYENEREFFDGLVLRETSENKLCKVAKYLDSFPPDVIEEQIRKRKMKRPDIEQNCLRHGNLARDFNL